VLAAQEKILGGEHPSTLTTMHNLAVVYESQARYTDAKTLYKRVLAAREKILGGEHPDTLTTTDNLAFLYERHADIQTLHGRTLADQENIPDSCAPNRESQLDLFTQGTLFVLFNNLRTHPLHYFYRYPSSHHGN
jgi:Tetratricopeptide repeat